MSYSDPVKQAQRHQQYYLTHREEILAYHRQYNLARREEHAQYNQQYYSEHAEEIRAQQRQYNLAHREKRRAYTRKWGQDHPDRRRMHWHIRRAQKNQAPCEVFMDREIFERDGWICQACGITVRQNVPTTAPNKASLDHITPLARGGSHTRGNVQCLCLPCNLRKYVSVPPGKP